MIVVLHTEEGKGPRVRDTCLNWKKTLGLKIKKSTAGHYVVPVETQQQKN